VISKFENKKDLVFDYLFLNYNKLRKNNYSCTFTSNESGSGVYFPFKFIMNSQLTMNMLMGVADK
jgi:hypothetical protein